MKGWFLSTSHVCACVILLVACGGEEAAETGSNVVDACADLAAGDLCPPGTTINFEAAAIADCGGSAGGTVGLTDGSAELSARCGSQGDCSFLCVPPGECCGGEKWSETSYECETPCAALECSCDGRCGAIKDGDCDVDCGTCAVGQVCTDAGVCEAGCAEGAVLCAGSCCGSGEVCYLNQCCNAVGNCAGKECGPDLCGDNCNKQDSIPGCAQNQTCENGVCSQTCLLGDVRCFTSGGQQKVQECQQPPDGLLGWYVIETCLGDAPNCLPSNLGATCVSCTKNEHCGVGQECEDDECTGECAPQCEGYECGDDQCDGVCGTCDEATEACLEFKCENIEGCEPVCDDKTCGEDGCGGTCGDCGAGEICKADNCCDNTACDTADCGFDDCGNPCGDFGGLCDDGFACSVDMQCLCAPACGTNLCGDDGCGGSCGECASAAAPVCDEASGECTCIPFCEYGGVDKACGDDGCGGSCGTCTGVSPDGQTPLTCQEPAGECVSDCTASCIGQDNLPKECGGDGCGGSCGECGAGMDCVQDMLCTQACEPQCADEMGNPGSTCGADGCGGSCGTCPPDAPDCVQAPNGMECAAPAAACGSVNLIAESSGGARLDLPQSFDNTLPGMHDHLAFGVWIKGPDGDTAGGNRTVVSTMAGLEINLTGKNNGTSADFNATFPDPSNPNEVVEFTKQGVSSYGSWWKSGVLGYPWAMVGFVKIGGGVTWCAQHSASGSPQGYSEISDSPVSVNALLGGKPGEPNVPGIASRIGQAMNNGSPLRARVGGVRIFSIEASQVMEVGQSPCMELFMAMEADPTGQSQSALQVLQSWSLNTWPDGNNQTNAPPGAFWSDQEQLFLSLMDENDWNEQENFSVGICPVAY